MLPVCTPVELPDSVPECEPRDTVPDAVKSVNAPVDCVVTPIAVPSIEPPVILAPTDARFDVTFIEAIVPIEKLLNCALLKSIVGVPSPVNVHLPLEPRRSAV